MTINERVSPKRLAEIIARAEVCDDSVLTDYRDIESIARELQQYRAAAEPVAWVMKDDLADTDIISTPAYLSFSDAATKTLGKLIPLYAAPQVTSVPSFELFWSEFKHPFTEDDELKSFASEVWNACCGAAPAVQAEQLSGNTEQVEPVSQPYTLPECFERLFKHAQGLTFGDDWNRGTAAKYHRDSLIKAVDNCRAAIASGNSPAIQNGWIPVSERMPGSRHAVLVGCWFGSEWTSKWATYVPGHPDAQDSGWLIPGASWTPTHWHELPAAPKQEAE